MSVNRNKPHLLVLPEDDANRQIANGFAKNLHISMRALQVLPVAGGWNKVLQPEAQWEYAARGGICSCNIRIHHIPVDNAA